MDVEGLVAEARERRPKPMSRRERRVAAGMAAVYALAAVAIAVVVPSDRHPNPLVLAACVAVYALTMHASFEVGSAVASPTALAFVPLLFIAPLQLVPVLVVAGHLAGSLPDYLLRRYHPDRMIFALADNWWVIGPVLVLGLCAPGPPSPHHAPVYLMALGAQIVGGAADHVVGDVLMYGMDRTTSMKVAFWGYGIGAILTPVAYLTATVAVRAPIALATVPPLLWLLNVFSRERKERYAAVLELSQAYRGTVMVLADVVEADDNYTAYHCRSVVDLAHAVGEELRLTQGDLQELEIAALLHDVGKIAIPKDILNKPARLTSAEFELMKTHTIEGQALLDRIGGRLANVGSIVRSCHERWDGRGYPDGLMGEEIPRAARIVFCCDAYSAMTTDRPYRKAMDMEAAIAELRGNSGSQFEPRVVEALVNIITEGREATADYSDAVRAVLATHSRALALEHSA